MQTSKKIDEGPGKLGRRSNEAVLWLKLCTTVPVTDADETMANLARWGGAAYFITSRMTLTSSLYIIAGVGILLKRAFGRISCTFGPPPCIQRCLATATDEHVTIFTTCSEQAELETMS